LVPFCSIKAQVQGVSAEKLVAINPFTVEKRTVEFEPLVGYLWSTKMFNNAGKAQPLKSGGDSTLVLQTLGFRVTYGFADRFEVGGIVTTDLNSLSLGLKYNMFKSKNYAGAILFGTTFSNESDFVFRNSGFFGKTASLATGFSFTNKLSKYFSVDYDLQYQNLFDDNQSISDDYFASFDFGFHFKGSHIAVAGLSYKYNNFKIEKQNACLLTLNTGLVVQTGKMFILVLNFPIDLYGRNVERFYGFSFALTITFD
jgi:hypothetical protein